MQNANNQLKERVNAGNMQKQEVPYITLTLRIGFRSKLNGFIG